MRKEKGVTATCRRNQSRGKRRAIQNTNLGKKGKKKIRRSSVGRLTGNTGLNSEKRNAARTREKT